ncbi:6,7-dimethyl-8-ribityllumazine synthase [Varunaivibrio sulfuroxidans]|uniref:6,7-dimethyl-8-ribityllumazine synthase n=1 Tax=Varunaivibrio sulfuroxidans TaxID=1773489 RepID=A0A4R3JG40_9PROT|nr:6,7-dimethyl-8-ribityllumazine synthase [Varunaivibrio sulfuroxidans]TCS64263.1 6,7-dimethyl-8-ribityllumazine synthase [Varunaivibrio sulfuroxidans]WES31299.1 6,7-dimethyl-8-ribityllumazine synthase [Varunaivibrio sulfuroxidans]
MVGDDRVLIVEARFYEDIADELVKGAVRVLEDAGIPYDRVAVPGVFEIPAAIQFARLSTIKNPKAPKYTGFVALGCVIRGETTHYDYVCMESARALMTLTTDDNAIALGYGVVTTENMEQAWARAGVDRKNKGGDVARACVRMMEIKRDMRLREE